MNTDGSFACECPMGYSGDGFSCNDVNECDASPCDANASCDNNDGGYSCACNDGYEGDGETCVDINECADSPCAQEPRGMCRNNDGSFTCSCNYGYEGDGYNCDDVDECENPDACAENATCSNTNGGFICECNVGYLGNGNSQCYDIDECEVSGSNNCSEYASCGNTAGGFECTCLDGYIGDGTECTKLDDRAVFDESTSLWVCPTGYSGSMYSCEDVDECLDNPCSKRATCTNTSGSFKCECGKGFKGQTLFIFYKLFFILFSGLI